jgi:hypothetical protein
MTTARTTVAAIGLSLLTTAAAGSAAAYDRVFWEGFPQAAYEEVYAYYCSPAEVALASIVDAVPEGDAAVIYEDLFLAQYGGSCRAFYFQEVASRYDAPFEQVQGLVVVNR